MANHSSSAAVSQPKADDDGFVGLTNRKALAILVGFLGVLSAGFLFLVIHVWDGIEKDISNLQAQSHTDLQSVETKLNIASLIQGKLEAFFQNDYPQIIKQLSDNTNAQSILREQLASLNSSVLETKGQVADLTLTVRTLRDSVLLKKSNFGDPANPLVARGWIAHPVAPNDAGPFFSQPSRIDDGMVLYGMTVCPPSIERMGGCTKEQSNVQ